MGGWVELEATHLVWVISDHCKGHLGSSRIAAPRPVCYSERGSGRIDVKSEIVCQRGLVVRQKVTERYAAPEQHLHSGRTTANGGERVGVVYNHRTLSEES